MTSQVVSIDHTSADFDNLIERVGDVFAAVKSDSIVSRMPKMLHHDYFRKILEHGGRVLIAFVDDTPAGFLIFVSDNNVTLDFLREHKIAIALNLAVSGSWSDKKLLLSSFKNAVAMRGQSLPEEFKNEISLLAVDEGFQGRGLGALLVNELRRFIDTEIHVKTDSTNTDAIRFYEKNRFEKSQTLRVATRELVCFKSEKL